MSKQVTMEYLKAIGEYQWDNRDFKRGDIWFADLGDIDGNDGSETKGYRPVIIIQNDIGNKYSHYVIVAVISSSDNKLRKHQPTQTHIQLDKPSVVLTECIKTIHKDRLCKFCKHLPKEDMLEVDLALMRSLGLVRI